MEKEVPLVEHKPYLSLVPTSVELWLLTKLLTVECLDKLIWMNQQMGTQTYTLLIQHINSPVEWHQHTLTSLHQLTIDLLYICWKCKSCQSVMHMQRNIWKMCGDEVYITIAINTLSISLLHIITTEIWHTTFAI